VARPQDAIPGDLDVVVRIDLGRVRSVLGAAALEEIGTRSQPDGEDPTGESRLLAEALRGADRVWIAWRPGLPARSTDSVVVLEGRFRDFDPDAASGGATFRRPIDLGAGWELYARPQPKRRGAVERIYLRRPSLMVLVSPAEVDSVERAVERGARDPHLEPPSRGVLSFEARSGGLSAASQAGSPALSRLLERATVLRGHASLDGSGLAAEVEIVCESEATAQDTARAVRIVAAAVADQSGWLGGVARSLVVSKVGTSAVIRLTLDRSALDALVRCASGDPSCDRAGAPAL
jgi:hypothetical protein